MWQTSLGSIEIIEKCFLMKGKYKIPDLRVNPFEERTCITNHCYSKRCQKFMTDFGIEESFHEAAKRMKEHHGVDVNVCALRHITQKHARRATELLINALPVDKKSKQMVLEMDGEMVPLVEYKKSTDKRKTKTNLWGELRVSAVQNHHEVNWKYASSFNSPDELGDRTRIIMESIGFDEKTLVHGVGDGAKWIYEQGERLAGSNFSYTIDQPHLCEYFTNAAKAWREDAKEEVKRLKKLADEGKIQVVVEELEMRQKEYPLHKGLEDCLRYIKNRPGQFEYDKIKGKELPVGSGKIESTHRSLMQKRLKKPGAWWLKSNADKMADLRTLRANGKWHLLWQEKFNEDMLKLVA
jgi:hypothetical protein